MPVIGLLHVTAHLGGGVGKVLSRLVEESGRRNDGLRHAIICLERPEKDQFAERVRACGAELLIGPSREELNRRIAEADIVQLEWWHHPRVAEWLCSGVLPPMRLIVWSHVSGLHPPEIPAGFLTLPHRFLFSSPCSWEHRSVIGLSPSQRSKVDSVFSSGGFEDLPEPPPRSARGPLRVGYVGTLNFAKLHPRLLDFLGAVSLPGFRLTLVGDPTTGAELRARVAGQSLAVQLEFRGYRTDVSAELARLDVLAYLLNPLHYGTTENALLEAMAMGVVPVVLDNPAERCLVRHGETGLVVGDPAAFAEALAYLADHPAERRRLSARASRETRFRFSIERTADGLEAHYRAVLAEDKRAFDLRPVFGPTPADWFRACQGDQAWRFADGGSATRGPAVEKAGRGPHYLYEKTKSSAFHYRDTFPDDPRLRRWAERLEAGR